MDNDVQFSILLMVIMFIISGFNKFISFGANEAQRFASKTGIEFNLSQEIVFYAGIWELLASAMILYGVYYKNPNMALNGGYALIVFTILATLIFYTFPLKYKPFLSNLSVTAGLYLMLNICFFKNGILA